MVRNRRTLSMSSPVAIYPIVLSLALALCAKETKVLHFPLDQCMGSLSVEDPNLGSESLELGRDLSLPLGLSPDAVALGGNWDFVGRALGDVVVPAEGNVQLTVVLRPGEADMHRLSELARHYLQDRVTVDPDDLSGLSGMASGDLYKLSIYAVVRRRDADQRILEPISRLEGLQILSLGQTGVTHQGLELLKSLPSLRALAFQEERIGVRGMAVLKDLPALEYLDCDVGATDAGLKHLGQCPNLRWMRIRMGSIWGPGLAELANLPRLERLALWGGTRLTDRHIRHLEGLVHLKSLTLWGGACDSLTDAALASIGKLSSLEELYFIRTTPRFTDAGITHLKSLTRLRHVNFAQAMVGDEGVRHLAYLPSLESIGGGLHVTAEGMKTLGSMRRLKRLCVGLQQPLQGYRGSTGVSHLRQLTSLDELAIDGQLTDEDLCHIESLPCLRRLRTQGKAITDRGMVSIAKLKELERLSLSRTRVTKRGLNELNGLTNLQSLSVMMYSEGQSNIDETPLKLSALTRLKYLSLRGLGLRDTDMVTLAGMRDLEGLWLSGDLTDQGLINLNGLPHLQNLMVDGLACSNGEGLAQLSGLKSLRDLKLEGQITDSALDHLGDLRSVWSLWIVTDETIRPETVARLRDRLPVIEHIHVVEPPRFEEPPVRVKQAPVRRNQPSVPRSRRRR